VYRAEDCIVTALLHDTLDDGDATLADVEALAGTTVAALVSTVARLSRNNQLLRRAYRRMIAAGEKVKADAEIEAMKSMILQMTEEPVVRFPLLLLWFSFFVSLCVALSFPFSH
jgi:(p)ppGpp synthase/HD superfamily hydrolase